MGKVLYLFAEEKGGEQLLNIFDVAKAFLSFESMTHKKLQKLCYYAQAWYYTLFGKPLFDEEFQAWIHGPVCPSLYSVYKEYGWLDIEKEERIPPNIAANKEIINLLEQVYRIYGNLSGDELERLTHSEEPWREARRGLKPNVPSNARIELDIMKKYCIEEYERSQND